MNCHVTANNTKWIVEQTGFNTETVPLERSWDKLPSVVPSRTLIDGDTRTNLLWSSSTNVIGALLWGSSVRIVATIGADILLHMFSSYHL